jgi:hypothetical protein
VSVRQPCACHRLVLAVGHCQQLPADWQSHDDCAPVRSPALKELCEDRQDYLRVSDQEAATAQRVARFGSERPGASDEPCAECVHLCLERPIEDTRCGGARVHLGHLAAEWREFCENRQEL